VDGLHIAYQDNGANVDEVWAAAMDISLALLPWRILWGLQMRMTEKVGVCVAMSLGIL